MRRMRKIQYPAHILKTDLTPEDASARWRSAARRWCPFRGEPLLHPRMPEIVAGLVARRKYVTCAPTRCCLKESCTVQASKYLSFSVHVDGQREHHDLSVCREGGYDIAMEGVRAAWRRGSA